MRLLVVAQNRYIYAPKHIFRLEQLELDGAKSPAVASRISEAFAHFAHFASMSAEVIDTAGDVASFAPVPGLGAALHKVGEATKEIVLCFQRVATNRTAAHALTVYCIKATKTLLHLVSIPADSITETLAGTVNELRAAIEIASVHINASAPTTSKRKYVEYLKTVYHSAEQEKNFEQCTEGVKAGVAELVQQVTVAHFVDSHKQSRQLSGAEFLSMSVQVSQRWSYLSFSHANTHTSSFDSSSTGRRLVARQTSSPLTAARCTPTRR